MFATAAIVANTSGKNDAMKIRKSVGKSPMPNQRMAKGIHARGDRLRKKFISGRNAARARAWLPSQRPTGMPVKTANPNPVVTRNNEATMSSTNRPVRISSTKPRATSIGDGKTDAGNTPDNESAVHTNNAQSKTCLLYTSDAADERS